MGGGVGGGGRRSRDIILHVVLYSVCFISLFNIFPFFFFLKKVVDFYMCVIMRDTKIKFFITMILVDEGSKKI